MSPVRCSSRGGWTAIGWHGEAASLAPFVPTPAERRGPANARLGGHATPIHARDIHLQTRINKPYIHIKTQYVADNKPKILWNLFCMNKCFVAAIIRPINYNSQDISITSPFLTFQLLIIPYACGRKHLPISSSTNHLELITRAAPSLRPGVFTLLALRGASDLHPLPLSSVVTLPPPFPCLLWCPPLHYPLFGAHSLPPSLPPPLSVFVVALKSLLRALNVNTPDRTDHEKEDNQNEEEEEEEVKAEEDEKEE